jgi:hypothetical protein
VAGNEAGRGNGQEGRQVVPIIRCASCGQSSFTFVRRNYFDHCAGCGKPLNGHQDMTAIESEIRERLYGRRGARGRAPLSTRGRVDDVAVALAEAND